MIIYSLGVLGLSAVLLVGGHLFLSWKPVRGWLIARLGSERRFQGLYSLVAVLGLAGLGLGYAFRPGIVLWQGPVWLEWVTLGLMPIAFLLLVGAYTQTNPGALNQEEGLDAADPAPGILAITRHPFQWGVILLALLHLLVNGDLASLILFGALILLSGLGSLHLDTRRREAYGARWARYERLTSHLPFWGILTRKTHLVPKEIGPWVPLIALAAYLIFLYLHPRLFGVSPFPG